MDRLKLHFTPKDAAPTICNKAETGYFVNGDLFIPLSLGNHYYSARVLRQVMAEFISGSRVSVIFLCDHLRFISYRIRGETSLERLNAKIQIQVEQMTRTLNKLGLGSYPNAVVANWSFLEGDQRYAGLLSSLAQFVKEDAEVRVQLNDYANGLLQRFHEPKKANLAGTLELQLQYILEETALSLFMTEIRGHNVEIYRRGMGFVDYLYDKRPEKLKSLTGAPALKRKFVAIEDWLGRLA